MGETNGEGENKCIVFNARIFDLNLFLEERKGSSLLYTTVEEEKADIMSRRCHLKELIHCKVISGESLTTGCWCWTGNHNG